MSRPRGQQILDGIAVKVDNQIILRSDIEGILAQEQARAQGKPLPPNLRCQVLQSLVLNKLMLARADLDSVTVTDAQVSSELDRRMNYFVQQVGSEKKLEELYNKPARVLKEDLRPQVRDQLVQQKMQEQIAGKVTVTPREVKEYFDKVPKDSIPYFSTEVEVGEIVIPAQVNDAAKQAAIAQLNDLRARCWRARALRNPSQEILAGPRLGGAGRLPGLLQKGRAGARVRGRFAQAGARPALAGGGVAVRLPPYPIH